MSVVPVSQSCTDAASGQCLLPEDAFPWLFRRAHTCMLSPLSVCSLTFGTVKIEDTAGRKDANGLDGEERLTGWEACERSERLFKKFESLLQHFPFEGCRCFSAPKKMCLYGAECHIYHCLLKEGEPDWRRELRWCTVRSMNIATWTQQSFLARCSTTVDLKGTRCASTAGFQLSFNWIYIQIGWTCRNNNSLYMCLQLFKGPKVMGR